MAFGVWLGRIPKIAGILLPMAIEMCRDVMYESMV